MAARSSIGKRQTTNTTAAASLVTLMSVDVPTFDGLAFSNSCVYVYYTLTWNKSGVGGGTILTHAVAQLSSGSLGTPSTNSTVTIGSGPPTVTVTQVGTTIRYNITPADATSTTWLLVARFHLYDPV